MCPGYSSGKVLRDLGWGHPWWQLSQLFCSSAQDQPLGGHVWVAFHRTQPSLGDQGDPCPSTPPLGKMTALWGRAELIRRASWKRGASRYFPCTAEPASGWFPGFPAQAGDPPHTTSRKPSPPAACSVQPSAASYAMHSGGRPVFVAGVHLNCPRPRLTPQTRARAAQALRTQTGTPSVKQAPGPACGRPSESPAHVISIQSSPHSEAGEL